MKRTIETRVFHLSDLEVRADGDAAPEFSGYAAVFNQETELWPGFREQVAPGAFTKTLQERDDVVLLFNHDSDTVLASTKGRSLTLSEDSVGLKVNATLDPTDTDTQRVVPKMKRGDIDQMSFGFQTIADEFRHDEDGTVLRTLKEVKLWDVSVVTWPAYPGTEADVRALAVRDIDSQIADVAGVDVEAWTRALAELKSGAVLEGEQAELVRGGLRALNELVEHSAPPTSEDPDAVAAEHAARARQLSLLQMRSRIAA